MPQQYCKDSFFFRGMSQTTPPRPHFKWTIHFHSGIGERRETTGQGDTNGLINLGNQNIGLAEVSPVILCWATAELRHHHAHGFGFYMQLEMVMVSKIDQLLKHLHMKADSEG